jgi:hypothetical protein
LSADS